MPTLAEIRDERVKKEVRPFVEPSVNIVNRAEKVFDISTQQKITFPEADAQTLVGDLMSTVKGLEDSPIYTDIDGLIDVFDPAEPPSAAKPKQVAPAEPVDPSEAPAPALAVSDPMAELARAELAMVKEPAKWAMRGMSYLFSPIDRAFKFVTNATMYDPLLKATVGPTKRLALATAMSLERSSRAAKFRTDNNIRPGQAVPQEELDRIGEEVNVLASGLIKQVNSETAEPVTLGDFGRSAQDALKALVPWPGFADDVRTRGQIGAESFERIVGREAPGYYAPLADFADQTVAMIGLAKVATAARTARAGADAATIAAGAKLTRAEVKAMKKLHKAASEVPKITVRAPNVPSPVEASTVTQKLIKLIKEAKPLRNEKALLLHQDRQRKAAKLAQVQKNVRGQSLVRSTKGALKGKAPIPDFDPLNVNLSAPEIDALFNIVNTSPLAAGFNKGNATLSLDKLLKGNLLTKSEIANLETVFGKQLTKALFGKQSISSMIQDLSFEVINLPRAILASFDLSAAGRQGVIFSVSHPLDSMKAFGRSVRAAASLEYADDIERVTRNSRFGQLGDKFGIHSSPTGFTARKLAEKEELYMSRIAEKIPGVAQSERAFTTFLNQQRRLVFEGQAKKWIRSGITPGENAKDFQQLATFINHATGRGSLEGLAPGKLTALNAVFFSPRFQVSRVQVVGDLISPATTLNARKVIARDLAEFYATGMGIMAVAKMGGAEVETDPRSSDFGKIKVGNTRYNYWGAFQPMATFMGRLVTGQIKSTGTGKIKKKDRFIENLSIDNIVTSFLRTKLAPVPGRVVDVGFGETVLGELVEPTKEFAGKTAFESLVPLFIQDSVDAWRFQGADAQFPLSAGLAFTGIGVQTWELAPFAEAELARDSLARQTYGKNYDELGFMEVQLLDADILVNHPGIVELEREAKFDNNSVNFLTKQARELRKSERFLEKNINQKLLADLNETKISLGGVNRTFGSWRLNDEQYKEYQERVAQNINELFEDFRPVWDTTGANSVGRYEIMTKILLSAKQLAAQEMKIGDME